MMSLDEPRASSVRTAGGRRRAEGAPHLLLEGTEASQPAREPVLWLDLSLHTIGSHSSCDVVLPGLEALHAVVFRDDSGELVLDSCGPATRVDGVLIAESVTLRTGARIDVGTHSLTYSA